MVGIGPQEAHGISLPGHRAEVTLLERKQIGWLDAQIVGDVVEILATLLPGFAQMPADIDQALGDGVDSRIRAVRSA